MRHILLAAVVVTALAVPAVGQSVDRAQVARIIDDGTTRSQIMPKQLSDVIGLRLTKSPSIRRAEAWTRKTFADWGLKTFSTKAASLAAVEKCRCRRHRPNRTSPSLTL